MLKHFQSFSTFSDRVKVQNEERKLQEKTTQQKEYADFFLKLLQQYDVTSPEDLDDAKKKEFFDKVSKGWDKGTGITDAGKTMVKESYTIEKHAISDKDKKAVDSSVKSPTSTEVKSPTSTEVRSPTSTETSTDAYTSGNITVTGGAGAGSTEVHIHTTPEDYKRLQSPVKTPRPSAITQAGPNDPIAPKAITQK